MFTFLPLECEADSYRPHIFIGTIAKNVTSGRICYSEVNVPDISFQLNPNDGNFFLLPSQVIPDQNVYNSRRFSTVIITSNEKIEVYGYQECKSRPNTASAFRVNEVAYLGTEYRVNIYWKKGISQFGVVATSSGITSIIVHHSAIGSLEVTLRQYEAYYYGANLDITGTHIISDQIIFVIAGNTQEAVVETLLYGTDGFCESLDPLPNWGTNFSFVAFPEEDTNYQIRVLSHYNDTEVRITSQANESVSMMQGGEYLIRLYNNASSIIHSIKSSHPISVSEFFGRVAMTNVPSLPEQGSSMLLLPVFVLERFGRKYFITIWVSPTGIGNPLYLDDSIITPDVLGTDSFGNAILQIPCTAGLHILVSNITVIKMATVSGFTDRQSYSYVIHS